MKYVVLFVTLLWVSISAVLAEDPAASDANPADLAAELSAEEDKLINLTNAERKKLNLPPLRIDPALMKIARAHSATMARLDEIGHDLEGQTFSQRMKQANYRAMRAGENVAQGQRTPEEAVADWMQSLGHKANILQTDYTHVGVAKATSKSGQAYYTQVFAKPVNPPAELPILKQSENSKP